jgi:acetyl esterase/lipase
VRRRLLIAAAVVAVAAAAGLAGVLIASGDPQPAEPSPFYDAPSAATLRAARPGTILRTQPVAGAPAGTRAWRVLYRSVREGGAPGAFSGLIVVPNGPVPPGGRPVVAHPPGTLGVASRCGLSTRSSGRIFDVLHGLPEATAADDVVVVPDYEGLGTRGPHPYLVGPAEARATLDLVRAARRFAPAHAGGRFGVWGESQGGHAALWTGQLARSYAPELTLVGVGAAAPVTDLPEFLRINRDDVVGRMLSAYVLDSWSRIYRGLRIADLVPPAAVPDVRGLQDVCLDERLGRDAAAVASLVRKVAYRRRDPWATEPWHDLLVRNSPGRGRIAAPILVTQGDADELVRPALTAAFVARLCVQGEDVGARILPGVDHREAGAASAAAMTRWLDERFAGEPAPSSCPA